MLSAEQRSQFQAAGFVVLRDLCAEGLAGCRTRVRHWIETAHPAVFVRYGAQKAPVFHKIPQLAERDEAFRQVAHDARIMAAVQDLVGQVALFRDVVVSKPPFAGSAVRYHQDAAYWNVEDPDRVVSAWIALDDAPQESGCLQFLAGTHRTALRHDVSLGRRKLPPWVTDGLRRAISLTGTGDNPRTPAQRLFAGAKKAVLGQATRLLPALNDLNELAVDPAMLGLHEEVVIPARVGDVVLFHSLLLHASGGNRSPHPRAAYIATYQAVGPRERQDRRGG